MVPEIWGATDRFFCHFGPFFALLLPLWTHKIKNLKKWYKHLEVSFYTHVPKTMIKCYTVSEIQHVMGKIFIFYFGLVLPFYSPNNPKNQTWKKKKKTPWGYYNFAYVHHKWQSYDVWFPRYKMQRTELFVIDRFLPFYPPNNPENQNFEKMKTRPGDFIILHMCTINNNHIMYGSWDTEPNGQNFLSFWIIFCPFTSVTTQKIKILKKWKKDLEISSFYKIVPKIMIICYTVPEIRHVADVIFIFHFGLFFALLLP